MAFQIVVCLAVLPLLTCLAAPVTRSSITLSQILRIAPGSSSCAGATDPSQCATAAQALLPIAQSFIQYGTTSPGEMAALISLMAYESGDFKYQVNQAGDPGRGSEYSPGHNPYSKSIANEQIARNMQAGVFNLLYAQSIPALAAPLGAITGGAAADTLTTSQLEPVLALLIDNTTYDFGSAAWFLTTQCTTDIQSGLQSGSLSGWQEYISECVGTAATADRQALWQTASTAFGQ
jgi:hypothetical protein